MYTVTWPISYSKDDNAIAEYVTDDEYELKRKLMHLLMQGHSVTVTYISNDEDN